MHGVARLAESTNDRPPAPVPGQRARAGVPLELGYLVTPVHPNVEVRHTLLGRAVQVMHDWSTLRGALLQDTLMGSDTELRLLMHTDPQTATSDVWTAAQHPLQLSVPYVLQVVVVDSGRPPTAEPRVARRQMALSQVVRLEVP